MQAGVLTIGWANTQHCAEGDCSVQILQQHQGSASTEQALSQEMETNQKHLPAPMSLCMMRSKQAPYRQLCACSGVQLNACVVQACSCAVHY
eukprot:1157790-Pelagomonas_calceolata.AAC.9